MDTGSEDPGKKMDIGLESVDSINNLDTARMALRWALERLQTLQGGAQRDAATLEQRGAVVSAQVAQFKLFCARLEEWLLLQVSEGLPARQAAEAAEMLQGLRRRQTALGAELQTRRGELERLAQGGAGEEPRRALGELREQDERIAHWEQVLARKAAAERARGELAVTFEGLGKGLGDIGEAALQSFPETPPSERLWTQERDAISQKLQGREAEIRELRARLEAAESKLKAAAPPLPQGSAAVAAAPAQGTPPPLMPEATARELVEKFAAMLRSWDAWESARRRSLEEERRAESELLGRELSEAQAAGRGISEVLSAARARSLGVAARSQAQAVEEFRRMLLGWEAEHAARRQALEKALEGERERLKDAVEELQKLSQERRAAIDSQALESSDRLRRQLREVEARYQRVLARQQEEFAQAIQAREAEINQLQKAAQAGAEAARAEVSAQVQAGETGRLLEEERAQSESSLARERDGARRMAAAKDAEIAALKSLAESREREAQARAESAAAAARSAASLEMENLKRRLEEQDKSYRELLARESARFEAMLKEYERRPPPAVPNDAGALKEAREEIERLRLALQEREGRIQEGEAALRDVEAMRVIMEEEQARQSQALAQERESSEKRLRELQARLESIQRPPDIAPAAPEIKLPPD